jgi:hypothetical protein
MCFDVISFLKDNVNAKKDVTAFYNRPSLEPKTNEKGNLKRPHAPYLYVFICFELELTLFCCLNLLYVPYFGGSPSREANKTGVI